MSKKYSNQLLEDTQQVYNNIPTPCVYFAEHKAKSGVIRITDTTQKDHNGRSLKYDREEVDFILLSIRYKIKGESNRDLTIGSPLIKSLSHAAPIYEFSTAGTEGQIGSQGYVWNIDKDLIKSLPEVKKVQSAILLFGLIYKQDSKGNIVATLAQFEVAGGAFGSWINDSKGVNQTERFNIKIRSEVAKRPNNHPKAEAGSMLSVPGFEFNELDNVIGEYYISQEGKAQVALLSEYLENRTYEPGKVMEGTAEAVAAVAQQNAKSAAEFISGGNPIDDMNLDRNQMESDEELPKMG